MSENQMGQPLKLSTTLKIELENLKKNHKEDIKVELLTRRIRIVLDGKWFQENAKECARCKKTEKLTLDHIIPKDFLSQLGIDLEREYMPENYQILCKACNNFKSNRLDFSIPKTKELLLKLINNQ